MSLLLALTATTQHRSTIYPEPQTDGDLASPWSFPFFPTQAKLQETASWISTNLSTTTHSATVAHGITTTGDWQIAFTADSASGAPAGVIILDGSLNGYWVAFGANLTVQPVAGGSPGSNIVSAARVAGANVSAFIEVSYTASTDTFAIYEDGAARGTGTNNTYESADKASLYPILTGTGSNATRVKDLYIQDYIEILGSAPGSGSTVEAVLTSTSATTATITAVVEHPAVLTSTAASTNTITATVTHEAVLASTAAATNTITAVVAHEAVLASSSATTDTIVAVVTHEAVLDSTSASTNTITATVSGGSGNVEAVLDSTSASTNTITATVVHEAVLTSSAASVNTITAVVAHEAVLASSSATTATITATVQHEAVLLSVSASTNTITATAGAATGPGDVTITLAAPAATFTLADYPAATFALTARAAATFAATDAPVATFALTASPATTFDLTDLPNGA